MAENKEMITWKELGWKFLVLVKSFIIEIFWLLILVAAVWYFVAEPELKKEFVLRIFRVGEMDGIYQYIDENKTDHVFQLSKNVLIEYVDGRVVAVKKFALSDKGNIMIIQSIVDYDDSNYTDDSEMGQSMKYAKMENGDLRIFYTDGTGSLLFSKMTSGSVKTNLGYLREFK